MNVTPLTLRDLEYVLAVAKHQHFGRAARECNVSQPSLSTQIRKIESYLGVALFERTNRRVTTTAAGQRVARQARVVIDEAVKIPSLLADLVTPRFDQLKLGVIFSMSPLVPHLLASLKKEFPKCQLSLLEGTTAQLVQELKVGHLDAVIASDTIKDSTLKISNLFFEPFVLAAPKGSAILGRGEVKPSDLKSSDMVLLDEGHCLRDQTLQFCPVNRRGKPRAFHATSLDTLQHLVASGAGYTLLPKLAAIQKPMKNLIGYLDFKEAKFGRNVVAICRETYCDLAQFKGLIQALVHAVPKSLTNA